MEVKQPKLNSKLVKFESMKAIKSLSKKERKELLETDYSKESLLDNSIMLSDAMISRLVDHQNELITRYELAVTASTPTEGEAINARELEVTTNNINGLSKAIADISKIIQIHQAQINATLKTRKELRDKNENELTLQGLQEQLLVNPKELIQDLIKGYLTANPGTRVDELLQLKPADVDIEYEMETDD
jgi:integrase